jgi:hypothetical protein
LAQALQQLEPARVLQVADPNRERVRTRGRGNLVKKLSLPNGVLHTARSANPRRRQRVSTSQCAVSLLFGNAIRDAEPMVVQRRSGAELRQVGEHGRQQRDARAPHRSFGHEYVRFPRRDPALVVDAGAIVEQQRRPFRIPAVLVLAHPLQPDGRPISLEISAASDEQSSEPLRP